MSTPTRRPTTLLEAIRHFSDLDVCTEFVAKLRWPRGPVCPRCGSAEYSYLTTRRVWKCKGCKKQYSVKVGTIFEDSPLGLDKWLPSVWLIANSKNGISSHELGRALGITQKSAWFMLHRIRLAMQTGTFNKLDGTVEVDETFIGGKARNMHKSERARKITGRGPKDKTAVAGVLQRGGEVRASVVASRKKPTLQAQVRRHVEPGAAVYTDALESYSGLDRDFAHETVDHAERYVDGQVHTNGIENFWSLLKRGLHGTYISVEPYHLFRYLDERVLTYNLRDIDDFGRFERVMRQACGRRLTWPELVGER
ncbi:MAG: IS1595 family transposase [Solirubrobacteraceae bacterium]